MRRVLLLLTLAACSSEPKRPPPPQYAPPMYQPPPAPYVVPPASPCVADGYACSADRLFLLRCHAGQSFVAGTCRGPKGCVVGDAIACDHSLALPGDACDEPNQGLACGMDRKTFLRCDPRRIYVATETCRNACLSTGGRVLCQ